MKANDGRFFGCSFRGLRGVNTEEDEPKMLGLMGRHAYSVLRAVQAKGKKVVVIRNPWGS